MQYKYKNHNRLSSIMVLSFKVPRAGLKYPKTIKSDYLESDVYYFDTQSITVGFDWMCFEAF